MTIQISSDELLAILKFQNHPKYQRFIRQAEELALDVQTAVAEDLRLIPASKPRFFWGKIYAGFKIPLDREPPEVLKTLNIEMEAWYDR